MLTPQELMETEFSKATFGGYDRKSVDDVFASVSEDYATLYKENNILKSKLKVLVDKIEEYRSTEDAMRMALLTAQNMGDEIIAEANAKRDKILAEAEELAKGKVSTLRSDVVDEQQRLRSAKQDTADYVARVRALMQEQEQLLARMGELTAPSAEEQAEKVAEEAVAGEIAETVSAVRSEAEVREEQIMDTAKQIDSAVAKIVDAEPTLTAPADKDEDEKTKIFKSGSVFEDEDEPDDVLREKINECKKRMSHIEAQIREEESKATVNKKIQKARGILRTLESTWPLMSAQEKQTVCQELIDRIIIYKDGVIDVHLKLQNFLIKKAT